MLEYFGRDFIEKNFNKSFNSFLNCESFAKVGVEKFGTE